MLKLKFKIIKFCNFRKSLTAVSKPLFLCRDEDGVQVLSLSDQRLVVLEVTVANMPSDPLNPFEDGDDAHAAQLVITLPPTLPYAGSRIPPQVGTPPYEWRTPLAGLCFSDRVVSFLFADEMPSEHQRLPGGMWPGEPNEKGHQGKKRLRGDQTWLGGFLVFNDGFI